MDKLNCTEKEKLMLRLSFIAYRSLIGDDESIERRIRRTLTRVNLEQHLVWGPAVANDDKIVNYALIYIVQDQANLNEYTVVIRGTNPISVYSWKE